MNEHRIEEAKAAMQREENREIPDENTNMPIRNVELPSAGVPSPCLMPPHVRAIPLLDPIENHHVIDAPERLDLPRGAPNHPAPVFPMNGF